MNKKWKIKRSEEKKRKKRKKKTENKKGKKKKNRKSHACAPASHPTPHDTMEEKFVAEATHIHHGD
jgi:hypothetical protein